VAGDRGGCGVWNLFCGAEVCGECRGDLAAGYGEDGEFDGVFAAGDGDGFEEDGGGGTGSSDADGSGVGAGGGVAGYFGESSVCCRDARGATGCGGGVGFALSGIDDSVGGVDAAGAAYAAAGVGHGGGCGGGGDDYVLALSFELLALSGGAVGVWREVSLRSITHPFAEGRFDT
jgi:hypothetical protein